MRARKVDSTQSEFVKYLRDHGCSVFITSMVGNGFPDIIVGHAGRNYLVEIKDGAKPLSAQRLTTKEIKFHNTWQGDVSIINSYVQLDAFLDKIGVL